MDFHTSEDLAAVRDRARENLTDRATPEVPAWTYSGMSFPRGSDAVLVPATTDPDVGIRLVDAEADGVRREQSATTIRNLSGHPHLDRTHHYPLSGKRISSTFGGSLADRGAHPPVEEMTS